MNRNFNNISGLGIPGVLSTGTHPVSLDLGPIIRRVGLASTVLAGCRPTILSRSVGMATASDSPWNVGVWASTVSTGYSSVTASWAFTLPRTGLLPQALMRVG